MQLRAGDEMAVCVEAYSHPVAKRFLEPCTPDFIGFGRERRCGYYCELRTIDELPREDILFRLRQRG